MLTMKTLVSGAMASFLLASGAQAANEISKEEMVKFVDEAVEFAKKVGKDAAIKEFNDQKGKFWRHGGELYIFAYTMDGTNLALPAKPALIGKNLIGLKDPTGVPVIKAWIDAVNNKDNKGTLDWMWENPATKKVEPKTGYSVKMGDWFLGSGIYLPAKK